jgi:hypothetical protein
MDHSWVLQPQVDGLTWENASTDHVNQAETDPRKRHLPLNLPLALIFYPRTDRHQKEVFESEVD